MGMNSRTLASGPGWRIEDIVCSAGPGDRPFEEQHESACIAAVTRGSFRYRTTQGTALMAPGALLLGEAGRGFECDHEHHRGDRCFSFHFAPALLEEIGSHVPGVRRLRFDVPRLPPLAALVPLLTAAETARDRGEGAAFEEIALQLAGTVYATLAGAECTVPSISRRDEQRVAAALRRIETAPQSKLALDDLAREAASSRYHFLRIFHKVVGVTPRQFILRTRLQRAAVDLRLSNQSVSAVAFDAGFEDLSTFDRLFRRVMGTSPRAFRGRDRGNCG